MKCLRNNRGFTLLEMLIAIGIFTLMMTGAIISLTSGQNSWLSSDLQIDLQDSIRKSFAKVSSELRQSSASQVQVVQNGGTGSTDSIAFAIPIRCEADMDLLGAGTSIQYWGAPLTWGCTSSTCMDADNDCSTLDYSQVQYMLNGTNLVRRVLDSSSLLVQQDTIARDVTDLQITVNTNVVTIDVTAQQTTALNTTVTATMSLDVYMRN